MAVLVIGVSTQIGLEIIRSLGSHGVDVYALGTNRGDVGFYSRYTKKKFLLSFSPEEVFIERLLDILKKHPEIEAIFAIAERMLVRLNRYRSEIEKYARMPWPAQEILDYALDRRKTLEVAQKLDIPIPETVFLDRFEDVEKARHLPFPVITKPAARDFRHPAQNELDFRVSYFDRYEDLEEHIARFKDSGWFPMIQTCCQGKEVGFAVIMARGKPITCFQYWNQHLSPVRGGVPILRKSIPIDPELKEYSLSLLKAIAWEGVAEIDYIEDHRDGQFKLLEINGRFWGGTPLPSKAGLPFPWLLYQALVKGEDFYTEDYQVGIRCCVLGGEITRFLEILRSPSNTFDFSKTQATVEFLRLFVDPSTRFDIQDRHDFLPGLIDIGQMFKKLLTRR